MGPLGKLGKRAFVALLCLSLGVWSLAPSVSHVPTIIATPQDHAELTAQHGHSHGFEDDIYWAVHGHGHDAADHDHNQAALARGVSEPVPEDRDAWRLRPSPERPAPVFRIERPPRA